MRIRGIGSAVVLGACFVAPSGALAQQEQDTPSLTTEDVVRTPDSTTNANARAADAAAAKADAEAKTKAAQPVTADGYAHFVAPSGYAFDRPADWKPVENLQSNGAPSAFKYDAVFQDAKTGAVVSAVSVDKTQLGSIVDIGDEAGVNKLLSTMLNPTNAKSGVKLFRQTKGEGPNGSKWIRVKAQGTGQATDGSVVDTTFWVQIVQSDAQLALVAVGYPSTKEKEASVAAFHTVRTLEIGNASGSAGAAPGTGLAGATGGAADSGSAKAKKNSAGGVRKQ